MRKIIASLSTFTLLCSPLSSLNADECLNNRDYGCGYECSRSACCQWTTPLVVGGVIALGVIAAIVVNDNSSHSSSHTSTNGIAHSH